MAKVPKISLIVPVLNEEQRLATFLKWHRAMPVEIIVVDGGSTDGSLEKVQDDECILVRSEPGRAHQMNAGANVASGELLLFLHVDTVLPSNAVPQLLAFYNSNKAWGRFDICLSGRHLMFRVIAWLTNWRSRLTGICTGDQGIFVRAEVLKLLGGFAEIALMEDIEISDRLKKISPPYPITSPVTTSSRRWETNGILNTIWLMWCLRLAYTLGVSPKTLVQKYYG